MTDLKHSARLGQTFPVGWVGGFVGGWMGGLEKLSTRLKLSTDWEI